MPQTIWARVETPLPHLGNAQIDPAFFNLSLPVHTLWYLESLILSCLVHAVPTKQCVADGTTKSVPIAWYRLCGTLCSSWYSEECTRGSWYSVDGTTKSVPEACPLSLWPDKAKLDAITGKPSYSLCLCCLTASQTLQPCLQNLTSAFQRAFLVSNVSFKIWFYATLQVIHWSQDIWCTIIFPMTISWFCPSRSQHHS